MLNPKQAKFVEQYLIDLNARQAAIRAGYSKKTAKQIGQRLLTKVDIQAAVQAGQKKAGEHAQMTVDSVIGRLNDVANRAKHDDDKPTEIRALELLGKHVGAFTERVQVSGNLSKLSDDEIERRIQERLAVRAGRSGAAGVA